MKKILLMAGVALTLVCFRSEAQVRINVNIGAPVVRQSWYGYDDDYYYMPDQGVYYNVRRGCYVYPEGGTWVYGPSLPARYGNCSYNNVGYYRVHDRAPFMRHDYYTRQYPVAYRRDYGQYRGGYRQDNRFDHRGGGRRHW
jgi:hypothetical protein